MKICDEDGCDREATVHLTKVVEGEGIKKVHLCKECASTLGVDTQQPADMSEFLLQVGGGEGSSPVGLSTCPGCGMDRIRLKKNMRVGCGDCYRVFSEELMPVIESMHHSVQHVGKVPGSEGRLAEITRELAILHEQLAKAVLQEQFEKAAGLRDKIRDLEQQVAEAGS